MQQVPSTSTVNDIGLLSVDKQNKALDQAMTRFLGPTPVEPDDNPPELDEQEFKRDASARFPKWFSVATAASALIVFLASFLASSYRVFIVSASFVMGLDWYTPNEGEILEGVVLFGMQTEFNWVAIISGVLMAIGAEFAMTTFQLYIAILLDVQNRTGKNMRQEIRIMYFATLLAIIFTLTMNYAYIEPNFNEGVLTALKGLVEVFIPPLFVVFLGFAIKSWLLANLSLKAKIQADYEQELHKIKTTYKEKYDELLSSYNEKMKAWEQKRENAWSNSQFLNLLGLMIWQQYQNTIQPEQLNRLPQERRTELVVKQIQAMTPPNLAELVELAERRAKQSVNRIVASNLKPKDAVIQNENGWFVSHPSIEDGRLIGSRNSAVKGYSNRVSAQKKAQEMIENI